MGTEHEFDAVLDVSGIIQFYSRFFYGLLQVSDYVGDFLGNIDRAYFLGQFLLLAQFQSFFDPVHGFPVRIQILFYWFQVLYLFLLADAWHLVFLDEQVYAIQIHIVLQVDRCGCHVKDGMVVRRNEAGSGHVIGFEVNECFQVMFLGEVLGELLVE